MYSDTKKGIACIYLNSLLKPFEETATAHGLKKCLQLGLVMPGMQFAYSKFRERSTLLMMEEVMLGEESQSTMNISADVAGKGRKGTVLIQCIR